MKLRRRLRKNRSLHAALSHLQPFRKSQLQGTWPIRLTWKKMVLDSDPMGPKRQTQPSMSVEEAAKPTFDISVGDPHKVGDLTSSHIVYQIRTKV